MDKNINIAKILKNVPKGTKLWSPICGECSLYGIDMSSDVPITVEVKEDKNNNDCVLRFAANGKYFRELASGECLLFPSQDNRDWSTFKAPWKHKHFEPFQKVLIVCQNSDGEDIWMADIYSHYRKGLHYTTIADGLTDDKILAYEGNEDKLGKPIE